MDIDYDPIALVPYVHELLELLPVSVFWKDTNSRYMGCNSKFAHDAGFTHTCEIVGKSDYDLVWHENAQQYRFDDDFVLDSGRPKLHYLEPQRRANGYTHQLLTNKQPIVRNGNVVGVLGVYTEITSDSRRKINYQNMGYKDLASDQYGPLSIQFDSDNPIQRELPKHHDRPQK